MAPLNLTAFDCAALLDGKVSFRKKLLAWYRVEARDLPWRGSKDPYAIWVSEIVLQQTRVDQGTPYIQRFLKRFPTVRALAAAEQDDVLKLWEGLGYYSRARNLHRAAKIVFGDLGGELPRTAKQWQELPGVGRYTAGAIASIAFGECAPVLDGNVKRVLSRLIDLEACIDDTQVTNDLWEVAQALVKGKLPGDFNQAMMELGAEVCKPKQPLCESCPVKSHCASFAADSQSSRPVRRAKAKVPHHDIVIAAISKNGRYLLGKRPPKGLLGGLWEFPGGKVEKDESHEKALKREVREELGITVRPGDHIATVNHAYTHFKVTLHVFHCQHRKGTPTPAAHTELKWVLPRDFDKYAFPKANHKFLRLLDKR